MFATLWVFVVLCCFSFDSFAFVLQTFAEDSSRADGLQHSVLSSNRSVMTVRNSAVIDLSKDDDSKLTFTCSDGLHP